MKIEASKRLNEIQASPETNANIKAAMVKIANIIGGSVIGDEATISGAKSLPDDFGLPGMVAVTGAVTVAFSAQSLKAAAKVLETLDTATDGDHEVAFEVKGGKLLMVIADVGGM